MGNGVVVSDRPTSVHPVSWLVIHIFRNTPCIWDV